MDQHGIFATVPTAQSDNLNLAFDAIGMGPNMFSLRLTSDSPPTADSAVTDYGSYNASATDGDAAVYEAAQSGVLPAVDVNGQPIAWGEGGVIGEADALAAFAAMQFWANADGMSPPDFAAAIMAQAGLSYVPDGV